MKAIDKFCLFLKENNDLDTALLDNALVRMRNKGESSPAALAKILVEDYQLEYDSIYKSIAQYYAFGDTNVDVEKLDKNQQCLIQFIHEKIDREFLDKLFQDNIFPYKLVGINQDKLRVLASNTISPLIDYIHMQTPYQSLEILWAPLKTIRKLVDLSKHPIEYCDIIRKNAQVLPEVEKEEVEVDRKHIDEEINKSLLVELIDHVLEDAVRKDASDIHIIPSGYRSVDMFLRIDGRLKLWHRQENTTPEAVAAVVKDRSVGVDRFINEKAQDGYAQRIIDDYLIRFRISVLPMISAEYERKFESIVIRIIDDRKVIDNFRKLGFQEQAERELIKAIHSAKGIVIVTGPTGSGKSTTLMAALNSIINPELNVITCEDPVEYVIKGARQLKIGYQMSFDEAMRSLLRHDPDVVMVGEIRDKITADIAVKLANTGHLTLTTLHTNNAPSAITRLYKMGIEPFLLAYSINIIIAQRLVRKLCDHCKTPISPDMYTTALSLGLTHEELESGKVFAPVGCKHCASGYKGRLCITEALFMYQDIRSEIVQSGKEINEERIKMLAQKHGMLTMRESGLDRIRNGLTSVQEIMFATEDE